MEREWSESKMINGAMYTFRWEPAYVKTCVKETQSNPAEKAKAAGKKDKKC